MKVILVFVLVLAFGLVSCRTTELNELRVSDSPESKTFTLVAKRETSIKQNPSSDSSAKAGLVCKIPTGTKVLVEGFTKYAEGSHVQVSLSAIIPAGAGISEPPQNEGEPSIVPLPSSDSLPPSNINPSKSSEPNIVTDIGAIDPFNLAPSSPMPQSPEEGGSSVECPLLGQVAYLYSEHFDGIDAAQPPMDALFEGYDRAWGERIAEIARKQPKGAYSNTACYPFVADVLEIALRRKPNWVPLNRGSCARSFSDGWNPKVNEREFRLRKIATRDSSVVDKLPVGSVLVTARCGLQSPAGVCAGPGYGDVMIKGDKAGTMYSAITTPPKYDKCGIRSGNLIAVFIPIK